MISGDAYDEDDEYATHCVYYLCSFAATTDGALAILSTWIVSDAVWGYWAFYVSTLTERVSCWCITDEV